MPLLKSGKLVDDPWTHVADEVAIPASGPVIVGLKRWREERAALIKRKDPVGVRLQSDHTAGAVADDLEHLGVVALAFPVFKDGRAYTNAITVFYQPAADGRETVIRKRHSQTS